MQEVNMDRGNLLVSIIVITYNSSKYVLETLNSAKSQTYPNIELIISDDCSSDDTVDLCKNWLSENGDSFAHSEIITAKKNTGIPGNCNRGVNASTGEWIKFIAGDDALVADAISNGVRYIKSNEKARIFASTAIYYKDEFIEDNFIETLDFSRNEFFTYPAKEQYKILLKNNTINAGTIFIQKNLLYEVGLFIEKYKYLEDYPMWLKITKAGVKIHYMDAGTLKYRVHGESLYSKGAGSRIFSDFYLKIRQCQKDMVFPEIGMKGRLRENFNYYKMALFDKLGINKNENLFFKYLFNIPTTVLKIIRNLKNG